MDDLTRHIRSHAESTRRFFLQLGALGAAAWSSSPLAPAADPRTDALLADAVSKLEYLTPLPKVRPLGRGNPPPSKLPPEQLREVGLHPDTWFLDVAAHTTGDVKIERPLTRELGTAFNWAALMKLADKHAVRYLHVCTCTNVADPFHMSLWEGVPLREVIWMAGPKANVRRIFYYGYTNAASERFQASLPLGRVLEDPPGELPVILAYKMNGQPVPGTLGGPVRLFAPGLYANRSIKWLQHIVLTNEFQANDSYALGINDVESPLKTNARFINAPTRLRAGERAALTGLAQVGMSGLSKVQFRAGAADAPWQDASILPPPENWGGIPGGKLPAVPMQINPATGKPHVWPLRYAIVHWAALLPAMTAGKYELCCRTIDANGVAQPLPRPLPRTGANAVQQVTLTVA